MKFMKILGVAIGSGVALFFGATGAVVAVVALFFGVLAVRK